MSGAAQRCLAAQSWCWGPFRHHPWEVWDTAGGMESGTRCCGPGSEGTVLCSRPVQKILVVSHE